MPTAYPPTPNPTPAQVLSGIAGEGLLSPPAIEELQRRLALFLPTLLGDGEDATSGAAQAAGWKVEALEPNTRLTGTENSGEIANSILIGFTNTPVTLGISGMYGSTLSVELYVIGQEIVNDAQEFMATRRAALMVKFLRLLQRCRNLDGDYVWTAVEYLGEGPLPDGSSRFDGITLSFRFFITPECL